MNKNLSILVGPCGRGCCSTEAVDFEVESFVPTDQVFLHRKLIPKILQPSKLVAFAEKEQVKLEF